MLTFVMGGAYQGKYEFAKTFELPVINGIQDIIRDLMKTDQDILTEIMKILEQEDCVAVCNEIGCGIVPASKEDRDYREMVGRVACAIAKKADAVYRVEAGIAQKIK